LCQIGDIRQASGKTIDIKRFFLCLVASTRFHGEWQADEEKAQHSVAGMELDALSKYA
jgi:hypothetical protein